MAVHDCPWAKTDSVSTAKDLWWYMKGLILILLHRYKSILALLWYKTRLRTQLYSRHSHGQGMIRLLPYLKSSSAKCSVLDSHTFIWRKMCVPQTWQERVLLIYWTYLWSDKKKKKDRKDWHFSVMNLTFYLQIPRLIQYVMHLIFFCRLFGMFPKINSNLISTPNLLKKTNPPKPNQNKQKTPFAKGSLCSNLRPA